MIEAINRRQRLALTDDGQICEITNLFDSEGEETNDYALAVAGVVKISETCWVAVDFALYVPQREH